MWYLRPVSNAQADFFHFIPSQITIAKKGADPQLKTLGVPTHDEDLRVRQVQAELESQKKEEVERAMKVDRDRIELLENLRQKQEREKIERQEPKSRSLSSLGPQEDVVRFRTFTQLSQRFRCWGCSFYREFASLDNLEFLNIVALFIYLIYVLVLSDNGFCLVEEK